MASTEQNFSGALATWKEISLSELQKTLDAQGIEIVDNQKDSLVGRKALAEKTKDFKKIPDEEKLAAFKGLLKAYQTEIDSLTKRSKASENAFLSVYKVLAEAPDPYPLLEAAVDQTVKVEEARELQDELQRLREDNAELRRRTAEIPLLDVAKKKAESRYDQLEQKMEETIRDKVTQKENEFNATYDEKLRNYEERERDLQRQVSLAKNQVRDLRMSNDSNQAKLLNQSSRQDQEIGAKLAESDMILADLERANSRVTTVERRNEILRAEIEAIRSGNETSDRVKDLMAQVSQLEAESERLSRALETQRIHASEAENALSKDVEALSKEIQKKTVEVDQMKDRIRRYRDYDEIKRELEIMKFVEFGSLEEDADADNELPNGFQDVRLPNPNADKANAHHGKSLEALLATKNKRILEELTGFRILHSELEASLRAAEEKIAITTVELEKQKSLSEQLESDLLEVNTHQTNGDTQSVETVNDSIAGLDLGKKDSVSSARTTPIPFSSSADTSILPIVTSQRDRFRQRNAELEEELRRQFGVISELRAEIKTLQADNMKLYEKVRYMQSYREESGSRPLTGQLNPLPAPSTRDDMSKYRTRYEEAMNPFEVFRGREATRAYQNLNPVERGVLGLTRAILGNRRARTLFVCYALGLHLLVMFATYECSTSGPHLQNRPRPN